MVSLCLHEQWGIHFFVRALLWPKTYSILCVYMKKGDVLFRARTVVVGNLWAEVTLRILRLGGG